MESLRPGGQLRETLQPADDDQRALIGAELASHTRAVDSTGVFVGLFLVGVGWSLGLVAGSSLLTTPFSVAERVPVQGAADLVMNTSGAIAGLSAGVIYEYRGYHDLSHGGGLVAAALSDWKIHRIWGGLGYCVVGKPK